MGVSRGLSVGKYKIGFLFGAGAEGKDNLSLPSGDEYLQRTLLTKYSDEFLQFVQSQLNTEEKPKSFYDDDPYWTVLNILAKCKKERGFSPKTLFTIGGNVL